MTETEIQKQILDYLFLQPDFVFWRNHSMGGKQGGTWKKRTHYDPKGLPDIIGYQKMTGIIIGIEVKTEMAYRTKDCGLSSEQIFFMDNLRQNGGYAKAVCSVTAVQSFIYDIREGEGMKWLDEIEQRCEKAEGKPDAEFIAHSRSDIPRLIKALRVAIKELKEVSYQEGLGRIDIALKEIENG